MPYSSILKVCTFLFYCVKLLLCPLFPIVLSNMAEFSAPLYYRMWRTYREGYGSDEAPPRLLKPGVSARLHLKPSLWCERGVCVLLFFRLTTQRLNFYSNISAKQQPPPSLSETTQTWKQNLIHHVRGSSCPGLHPEEGAGGSEGSHHRSLLGCELVRDLAAEHGLVSRLPGAAHPAARRLRLVPLRQEPRHGSQPDQVEQTLTRATCSSF